MTHPAPADQLVDHCPWRERGTCRAPDCLCAQGPADAAPAAPVEGVHGCDGGCDPASYWRQEAADARADAHAARRALADVTAAGEVLVAEVTETTEQLADVAGEAQALDWHAGYAAGRDRALPTAPSTPGEMLAYEDGPDPITLADRVLGLVVLGPWALSVWGWSVGVVAHEVVRAVRRR